MAGKVAIDIQIKNVKKITDLKNSLKALRKEQRDIEKATKDGNKSQSISSKRYKDNAKAIDGQSKSLRGLNRGQKDATKSSGSLSKSFIKAAAAITIVVGAFRLVSKALSTVVSTFTEFEFVMAKVRAVSGATDEEFVKLSLSAQELGRETFFTASQVGELQLAYSKLGFTTSEILAAQSATLDLATATGTDLARAAQVAGASIRGFQIDATESQRVVDVMAVAFSSSALDIEKWNTSMTKVAPIAAMAGFSIEGTAAIMGKLTDTGIEASIAGTSLRNILLKMQDPSSDLTKTIGHTVTNLDGMLDAFKDLKDEGTDLTEVLGFMEVRQVAAFSTMLESSDGIKELRDSLMDANGEGERMADMVGDTLQGGFLKLKSAMEGVSISLMDHFGDAMKKSVVRIAKFLNSLVKSEKGVKKFTDGLKLFLKVIKFVIGAMVSYVIGAKLAALHTKLMSSAFMTMATASQRSATMVRMLSMSLRTLKTALIQTGVGALVVALGFLIEYLVSATSSTEDFINVSNKVKVEKAYLDTAKSVEGLDKNLKSLTKTRQDMNAIMEKEGDNLKDNALESHKYNQLKKKEKTTLRNINGAMKEYNKDLVDQKMSIKEITAATDDLVESMNRKAYANIYTDMKSKILKAEVQGDMLLEQIENLETGWSSTLGVSSSIDSILKDVESDFEAAWYQSDDTSGAAREFRERRQKQVAQMIKDMDMTLGQFRASINGGTFDRKMANLRSVIEKKLGMTIEDMFSSNEEEAILPDEKVVVDAMYEMNEKINKAVADSNAHSIINEKEKQKAILTAQIAGTDAYLAQFKTSKSKEKKEFIAASNKRAQLSGTLTKLIHNQELEDIRTAATKKLTIAKQNFTNNVTTAHAYALEVNKINKDLLQRELDHLSEKDRLSKKGDDIMAKQATNELALKKLNMAELERIEKQAFDDKKIALQLEQSTTMMSQVEFDNRMLALEGEYLLKRADLHKGNALVLIDINNGILQNNIDVNKQQQEMLAGQISSMGGVGSALTSLAGDNEKLNFIKEAGNKISAVANVLSAAMALHQNLITLGIIKGTAAKAADIAVEGGGLAIKATGAILNQGKGNPFTSFFRIIAMAALISKVMGMWEEGGVIDDGKKFADGGMVQGASHAKGGVKFAVGGRVHELEGGEAVINKRSTAMYRDELSSMNQAGGGVKFADGGLLNSPSFAQQQFSSSGGGGGTQKVYVVEADISRSQKAVHVLEAAATI